jgi:hypothetical protein
MSVHADELARELADLTPDELVDVVTDALGQTQAAPWGPRWECLRRGWWRRGGRGNSPVVQCKDTFLSPALSRRAGPGRPWRPPILRV